MCGICGEVVFGGHDDSSLERVAAMAKELVHRGPDGYGLWHEDGTVLGHRRLSIIDLTEAASQPMTSPDGRWVISYNGEVYNFRELRRELEAGGETFSTRSDTEVVLRALAVWGLDALSRFNGMWAFALWDVQEKKLLLCRDGLGIKPVYWAKVDGGVVFASEITALVKDPRVSREIDRRALAEQVACRYVLSPRTLLKSVQKLPPGHVLSVSEKGIEVFPFWRLPIGEHIHKVDEDEALERFSEIFESSVKSRLVADVPVGVLLSGGVDSSAVAAAVRAAGVSRISTYTVAFDGRGVLDERKWAGEVARLLETDHHEIVITPERFADTLGHVLDRLDDPVADEAILPLFHVCGLASREVKVLLSGQGADEILGGYHLDRVLRQIRSVVLLRRLPGARHLGSLIASRDPKRAYLKDWEEIKNAEAGQLPGKIRYDLTAPLGAERMNSLLKECMEPPYDRTLDAFYTEVPSHRGPLDSILSALARGWLPDNLLTHSDRMSMAHSVEMRVPFLDVRLVEEAFTLPEKLKVRGGTTKYLLKRYAEHAGIPRNVAYRRKAGFPVPWGVWIRGPLRNWIRELLMETRWFESYFHGEGIEKALSEHMEGRDLGLLLWNLTVLAKWGETLSIS